MWAFQLLSFVGIIMWMLLALVSAIRKNGKAKRQLGISGAFLVVFIALVVTDPTFQREYSKAANNAGVKQTTASLSNGSPNWNLKEVDPFKNGNLSIAVNMVNAMGEMPTGEKQSPEIIVKVPWEYYGKAIEFKGKIGDLEDYPPKSDYSKRGIVSQIVIQTEGGTVVDFFSTVPSGSLKVGDNVTITGFPVGRIQANNKLGGKLTHLIVVTKKVE